MTVRELVDRLNRQPLDAHVLLRIDAEEDVSADYLAQDETDEEELIVIIVGRE